MHPIGTIIRKRFTKGWFEGEVIRHDPTVDFYYIKYTDGDTEEMTYMEVQQHKKPLQQYSCKHKHQQQPVPGIRAYICKIL